MRHAFAVGPVQRVGNFDGVQEHLLQRQGTFVQPLRERLAFEILHDEEVGPILLADVVEGADVGMIQAGNRASFALKPLAQLGTAGEMSGRNLNGDDAIEARVAGAIHLAHPARTDGGKDFVRPEASAGGQRHLGLDYTPRNRNDYHYLPKYRWETRPWETGPQPHFSFRCV